jgi:GNAT superfamily N-acetyltransferase
MTRVLTARVTRLEMTAPPAHRVPVPTGPKLALMRAIGVPLHFYRYIYEQVGKPHHWMMRRALDDEALAAVVNSADTEIEILYVDGAPAGFYELDLSRRPGKVEIRYFGLVPEFQGRGLSKFFLSAAIFSAWAHDPAKVTINTNTLDSPRALILYQKLGFTPVGWSEERVEAWE